MKKQVFLSLFIQCLLILLTFQATADIHHETKLKTSQLSHPLLCYNASQYLKIQGNSTTYADAKYVSDQEHTTEQLQGITIDVDQLLNVSTNTVSDTYHKQVEVHLGAPYTEASCFNNLYQTLALNASQTEIQFFCSTLQVMSFFVQAGPTIPWASARGINNIKPLDNSSIEPIICTIPFSIYQPGYLFVEESMVTIDNVAFHREDCGTYGKGFTIVTANWFMQQQDNSTLLSDTLTVDNRQQLMDQWSGTSRIIPIIPGDYLFSVIYQSTAFAEIETITNFVYSHIYSCTDELCIRLRFLSEPPMILQYDSASSVDLLTME